MQFLDRHQIAAVATGLAVSLFTISAQATECQFFDVDKDVMINKACTVDYENGSEVIKIGKERIVFVQKDRQGQWAVGTLNGKPAARYEINRSTYSYATTDLKQFLDYSLE